MEEIALTKEAVLLLHPRTKSLMQYLNIEITNVMVIEPVGYLEMVWLIDNAELIITDSGELQKEAYFFSKLCVTLRDETEWQELIKFGINILVGADERKILEVTRYVLGKSFDCDLPLYGNGDASKKILRN